MLRSERSRASIITSLTTGSLALLANAYSVASAVHFDVMGHEFVVATADRVLVAPVFGLFFTTTHVGSGNLFTYWWIKATPQYTVQAGDYLEYNVYVMPYSADTSSPYVIGGIEMDFSTASPATNGRTLGIVDQYGVTCCNYNPALNGAVGAWRSRKLSLAPAVGKTVTGWDVVCESNVAGMHAAVWGDIRVTDGAGTTRFTVYSTGEPSKNEYAYYSAGNINMMAGPANSFLAYAFDETGAPVVATLNWIFEGA
jgi:hypothetical protein